MKNEGAAAGEEEEEAMGNKQVAVTREADSEVATQEWRAHQN